MGPARRSPTCRSRTRRGGGPRCRRRAPELLEEVGHLLTQVRHALVRSLKHRAQGSEGLLQLLAVQQRIDALKHRHHFIEQRLDRQFTQLLHPLTHSFRYFFHLGGNRRHFRIRTLDAREPHRGARMEVEFHIEQASDEALHLQLASETSLDHRLAFL